MYKLTICYILLNIMILINKTDRLVLISPAEI